MLYRSVLQPFIFSSVFAILAMGDEDRSMAQIIVGHRGASSDAPENTLSAFRLAFEQGADGVEGDFYVTADQQVVCIHDKTTKRTAGRNLDVAKSTLAQLRELEYGSWFNDRFRGEPIPTFHEVLQIIPSGKWFVVELKTGPEIVPLIKQELAEAKREDVNILIIAFDERTVQSCKQQLPEYPVHWLTGFKEDEGKWKPSLEEVVATAKRCGADGVGFQGNRLVLTNQAIQSIRSSGLSEFHVWTVDLASDAKFFKAAGAFGITTNRPLSIRKSLNDKS